MAVAPKGIDVRQSTGRLLFRVLLQDSAGAVVTTGTTNLKLYELQDDGTLKSYDFNDNTFKTTVLTTENLALTHRTGNNATTNTGLWTKELTTLTGFTRGAVYFAHVSNTGAFPVVQAREFQFGGIDAEVPPDSLDRFERALRGITLGTVGGSPTPSNTTFTASALDPAATVTDQFKGLILSFTKDTTTANLRGQKTDITSSTSAGALTFTALTTLPQAGDQFVIE
jgi:hypothetical protein